MSGFLYFLPDRQAGLSGPELQALGLGHALDGSVHQQQITSGGPGGFAGVVMGDAQHCDVSRVRYVPAEQDWTEATGFWIGRWKGALIGPADLVRPKPLDGHFVELADGAWWLCPVAREYGIENEKICWFHVLPKNVSLGPDRKWHPGEVVPRYRRLWDLCVAWWDTRVESAATAAAAVEGDTIQFDFEGLNASAAECLATNYRLGPDEISLLGLFDSNSARNILDALTDVPSLVVLTEELQKKTPAPPPAG